MRAARKCIALDAARSRFRELADRLTTCHSDVRAELRQVADELGPPADYDAFLEDQIPGTPHHELHRWAESLAEDLDTDAADLLRTAAKATTRSLEEEWRERAGERPRPAAPPQPAVSATGVERLTAAEARATAHMIRASCERLLIWSALLALPPGEVRSAAEEDEAILRRYPALGLYLAVDNVVHGELLPAVHELEKAGEYGCDA